MSFTNKLNISIKLWTMAPWYGASCETDIVIAPGQSAPLPKSDSNEYIIYPESDWCRIAKFYLNPIGKRPIGKWIEKDGYDIVFTTESNLEIINA
jgi:hypothetical protein